jgi:plasmid stabilization system protein ParE
VLEIIDFLADRSGSLALARQFAADLRTRCRHWATLRSEVGRPRPDLGEAIRSVAIGNYIVLLRYRPGRLEVLRIVEGHRDQKRLKLT